MDMSSRRFLSFMLIGAAILPMITLGELSVQLRKVDQVPMQMNLSNALNALGAPFAVNGNLIYYKSDRTASEISVSIVNNGSVILSTEDFVSGNLVSSIGILHSDGNRVLVSAFSNFASPSPNVFYNTINLFENNSMSRILSRGTLFPGYPEPPHPANPIGNATISGNLIAFMIREGLVTPRLPTAIAVSNEKGEDVQIIAKEGDPAPGGGVFRIFPNFTIPYAHEGSVSFPANTGTGNGIYQWQSGEGLSLVLNSGAPRPEGGVFNGLHNFQVLKDGDTHYFLAFSNASAIYRQRGDTVELVVSSQIPIPQGEGNFLRFSHPSVRNNRLVFKGARDTSPTSPVEIGIYLEKAGRLDRIVDLNTNFGENSPPVDFRLSNGSAWIDDSTIGFTAIFADHSAAVYRAAIQELPAKLEAEFTYIFPCAGRFTLPSRIGYRYELLRSTQLIPNNEIVILSVEGTGGNIQLEFDDRESSDRTAFFRVREMGLLSP